MHQLNELLHQRITRRRFPVALGMGLTTLIGLLRLADRTADEEPVRVDEQPAATPQYGAWRPRKSAGPTV